MIFSSEARARIHLPRGDDPHLADVFGGNVTLVICFILTSVDVPYRLSPHWNAVRRDLERRTVARIEATKLGLDIRFVVTSLDVGSAEWIYDSLYCARGQAENLIKLHKTQLASDRTSCRSALANQVRLVLHTAEWHLDPQICRLVLL
jgi:hypothetical protein